MCSNGQSITGPRVFKISISSHKGQKKNNIKVAHLEPSGGIIGDAHSNSARPVSLLPFESFAKIQHPELEIRPGDFAENITTKGLDFRQIEVGTRLLLGRSVLLKVTQIGKQCHQACIIRELVGDCIMPTEGVFAKVIVGGEIREGSPIVVVGNND